MLIYFILIIDILSIIKFNFSELFFISKFYYLLFLLSFGSISITAQNSNPFDLDKYSFDTLDKNKQSSKNVFELDNSVIKSDSYSNPFDIKRTDTKYSEENQDNSKSYINSSDNVDVIISDSNNPFEFKRDLSSKKIVKKQKVDSKKNKVKKISHFNTGNNDFLLWVFLFVLVLIALLMTTNRQLVLKIFKTVWFYNLTNILFRNFGNREMLFYALVYINFIVNFAIYFYLFINRYYTYSGGFIFIAIVIFIFLIYVVKHFSLYLLNKIFPSLKKINVYNFTTTIFNISLGISLIPINILIAYGLSVLFKPVLILGAIIIVIFYILRLLRGFLMTIDYYNYSKFHYFLYLCALEFIPILFLYKFALSFL